MADMIKFKQREYFGSTVTGNTPSHFTVTYLLCYNAMQASGFCHRIHHFEKYFFVEVFYSPDTYTYPNEWEDLLAGGKDDDQYV